MCVRVVVRLVQFWNGNGGAEGGLFCLGDLRYLPADALAVLDRPKEDRSGQGVEEHQQKHTEYDEKGLAH